MILVQHHVANPHMSQKALIDWCSKRFDMPKRLSGGAMCKILKKDSVNRFMKLAKSEINTVVLKSKSNARICCTAG